MNENEKWKLSDVNICKRKKKTLTPFSRDKQWENRKFHWLILFSADSKRRFRVVDDDDEKTEKREGKWDFLDFYFARLYLFNSMRE